MCLQQVGSVARSQEGREPQVRSRIHNGCSLTGSSVLRSLRALLLGLVGRRARCWRGRWELLSLPTGPGAILQQGQAAAGLHCWGRWLGAAASPGSYGSSRVVPDPVRCLGWAMPCPFRTGTEPWARPGSAILRGGTIPYSEAFFSRLRRRRAHCRLCSPRYARHSDVSLLRAARIF